VPFFLEVSNEARAALRALERDKGLAKRLKAVRKALSRLEADPRYPALRSHRFYSLEGPAGEDVFVSYAEQGTPAAYRVIWCYGPGKDVIAILAIVAHP
jgi:hypothetical protein